MTNRTEAFRTIPILSGFLATLLGDSSGDDSMPEHHDTIYTCPDSTFTAAADICRRFLSAESVAEMLTDVCGPHWSLPSRRDADVIGGDLYLTVAGHGAGFWDGDWEPHGDALTEAAHEANKAAALAGSEESAPGWVLNRAADMFTLETYVGDDGHVYIAGR